MQPGVRRWSWYGASPGQLVRIWGIAITEAVCTITQWQGHASAAPALDAAASNCRLALWSYRPMAESSPLLHVRECHLQPLLVCHLHCHLYGRGMTMLLPCSCSWCTCVCGGCCSQVAELVSPAGAGATAGSTGRHIAHKQHLSAHNLGQAAAAAATDMTLEPLKQELVGT